ncbi:hypothetical protein [Pedobacter sp. HDW13]
MVKFYENDNAAAGTRVRKLCRALKIWNRKSVQR